MRAFNPYNSIAAEHVDDLIDRDDPEFADVKIRRFYSHHCLKARYIEVDARAIEGKKYSTSGDEMLPVVEKFAREAGLYYRMLIFSEN